MPGSQMHQHVRLQFTLHETLSYIIPALTFLFGACVFIVCEFSRNEVNEPTTVVYKESKILIHDIVDFAGYLESHDLPWISGKQANNREDSSIDNPRTDNSADSSRLYDAIINSIMAILMIGVVLYMGMGGHFLSTFSYILIERIIIAKCVGYPYEKLFECKYAREIKASLERDDVVICSKCDDFFSKLPKKDSELTFSELLALIENCDSKNPCLGNYAKRELSRRFHTLIVIPIIFSLIFIVWFPKLGIAAIANFILTVVFYLYMREKIKGDCCWAYFLPHCQKVDKLYNVMRVAARFSFFNSARINYPFGDDFKEAFIKQYKEKFKISFQTSETNAYWLPLIYVYENMVFVAKIVQHYYDRFTFARNMCFSCTLLSILVFLYITANSLFEGGCIVSEYTKIYQSFVLLIGFLFFIRYYYLYYNKHTKWMFRAFYDHAVIKNGKIGHDHTLEDMASYGQE